MIVDQSLFFWDWIVLNGEFNVFDVNLACRTGTSLLLLIFLVHIFHAAVFCF